jgi:opacity protein-like surface antigen
MKRLELYVLVFLVLASPFAFAQPQGGDWELSLGAGYTLLDVEDADDTQNAVSGLGSVGYFFTDSLELSLAFVGSYVVDPDDPIDDLWSLAYDVQLKYHFLTDSAWVPYVGILAGMHTLIWDAEDDDDSDTDPAIGALVGVKYYFNEETAAFAEFNYRRVLDMDLNIFGEEQDMDIYSFLAGVSFHFR